MTTHLTHTTNFTHSTFKFSVLLLVVFNIIGCQTQHLEVHSATDPLATLRLYETYHIEALNNPGIEVIPILNNAIVNELNAKGYTQANASKADLIIKYKIKVIHDEQLKIEDVADGNSIHLQTTKESIDEARMLVNAVDAKTNNVIWKASTVRNLHDVNEKTPLNERVKVGMSEIFADFPTK